MEFLETGGTLLVIAAMLVIIVLVSRLLTRATERIYRSCRDGMASRKTTAYRQRMTFVDLATLDRKVANIPGSVPRSAATLTTAGA